MVRRKRFDSGGSVMDKPVADMRDPRYRKQLERQQALEGVYPELDLMGVGSAARSVVGRGMAAAKKGRVTAPEIGRDLRKSQERDDFIRERLMARGKTPEEGARNVAEWEESVRKQAQAQREADRLAEREAMRKKGIEELAGSVGRNIIGSTVTSSLAEGPYIGQRRREAEEREMAKGRAEVQRKREIAEGAYKKGGSVSTASKRGDGIAQRGKTKGKFR